MQKDIRIRSSSGGEFDCYLATPDGQEKVPAIVLASAVHGVDKDVRAIADEFAARGYIAAAPDLFWRSIPGPLARDDDRTKQRSQPRLEKIKAGEVIVVDALGATEIKTKSAVEMLKRLGITGKAVLVDVAADEKLARSVRNIPGVTLVPSARLTAREVIGAGRVVATRGAFEKLQEALS